MKRRNFLFGLLGLGLKPKAEKPKTGGTVHVIVPGHDRELADHIGKLLTKNVRRNSFGGPS